MNLPLPSVDISAIEIDGNNTGLFRMFLNPPSAGSYSVATNTVFGWVVFLAVSTVSVASSPSSEARTNVTKWLRDIVALRERREKMSAAVSPGARRSADHWHEYYQEATN